MHCISACYGKNEGNPNIAQNVCRKKEKKSFPNISTGIQLITFELPFLAKLLLPLTVSQEPMSVTTTAPENFETNGPPSKIHLSPLENIQSSPHHANITQALHLQHNSFNAKNTFTTFKSSLKPHLFKLS